MNESEFNIDDILAEVGAVVNKRPLPPSAYIEEGSSDDIYRPSEEQAKNAAKAFERNIQRRHVLVFFETHAYILDRLPGPTKVNLYKREFSTYITDRVASLRRENNNGEADVLEKTDSLATREIIEIQMKQDIKSLGKQLPGTDAYRRIDARIYFLDSWEKLCDEVIDLEKGEGTS